MKLTHEVHAFNNAAPAMPVDILALPSPVEPAVEPVHKSLLSRLGERRTALAVSMAPIAAAAGLFSAFGTTKKAEAAASSAVQWQRVYAYCDGIPAKNATGDDGYINYINKVDNRINDAMVKKVGMKFSFSPQIKEFHIPPLVDYHDGTPTVDTTCAGLNAPTMGIENVYKTFRETWLKQLGFTANDRVQVFVQNPIGYPDSYGCSIASDVRRIPADVVHAVLITMGDIQGKCDQPEDNQPLLKPFRVNADGMIIGEMIAQNVWYTDPNNTTPSNKITDHPTTSTYFAGYHFPFNQLTINPADVATILESPTQTTTTNKTTTTPKPKPTYKLVADVTSGAKSGSFLFHGKRTDHIRYSTHRKNEIDLIQLVPDPGHPNAYVKTESGCENSQLNHKLATTIGKCYVKLSTLKADAVKVSFAERKPVYK